MFINHLTKSILDSFIYKGCLIVYDTDDMFPYYVEYPGVTKRFRTLAAAKCAITKFINNL